MVLGLNTLRSAVASAVPTIGKRSSRQRKSYASTASTLPVDADTLHIAYTEEANGQIEYWKNRFLACEKELQDIKRSSAAFVLRESQAEAKLASLQAAHNELGEKYSSAVRDYEELKESSAACREREESERASLQKELEGYQETKNALAALQAQAEETARDLAHLRAPHRVIKSISDTRSAELRDGKTYLTKTDTVTHADVKRLVQNLNSQISQLAALVTDKSVFWENRASIRDSARAYKDSVKWVGSAIADILRSSSHAEDPIWVQTALQAVGTIFASCAIRSWSIRFDLAQNCLLTDIHTRMFEHEPQAISSRWRVLTRRYARNSDTSDILPRLSDQLLEAFKNVVLIAGVRMMAPSLQWTSVQEKMKDIIVESMVVQKAIGEDIAFSDFEVICPESNTQFNADTMEDADDCGCRRRKSVAEGMPVLCTTELGLRRREKVGDQGGRSGIKHTTVMKAKVAL